MNSSTSHVEFFQTASLRPRGDFSLRLTIRSPTDLRNARE
ncbi:hypothetical protein FRUB_02957 [Fimbriiglobus ruber]|uniref:Uncharacterized protein n=1 Tax=Fimbriiglobus ruber TaxID=1908690 RepID=A0A225DXU7_9BACT|nr:hypothetical protein FRUB_02957 [Fimbriiglobus ruber]